MQHLTSSIVCHSTVYTALPGMYDCCIFYNCLYVTDQPKLKTEIAGWTLKHGNLWCVHELYLPMESLLYRMIKRCWTNALQSMAQWKRDCKLPKLKTVNYLDYLLTTSVIYSIAELYQQLIRTLFYQVSVRTLGNIKFFYKDICPNWKPTSICIFGALTVESRRKLLKLVSYCC